MGRYGAAYDHRKESPMSFQLPVVASPSALPLNVMSTVRTLLAMAGGVLVANDRLSASNEQTMIGIIMVVIPLVWNLIKNNNVVAALQAALTAPAVTLAPTSSAPPKALGALLLAMVMAPALLALVACGTTAQLALTEAQVANGSWASLDVVSNVLDAMAVSGTLHGANAQVAHDNLQKATAALTAADNARLASDNATADENIAVAAALIIQLDGIAGVTPK